jgi:diguanylate cyclase (GGDEF)-like protein
VYHSVNIVAERDDSGAITGLLAIGRDMTERKQMEDKLQYQAHFDYLTGLTNRRYFMELAANELIRFHRYGGELSLIMFDIDRFKQVNDLYGHSYGDLALQAVGDTCREILREVDIVGRIGGEEFAILLPQTGEKRAEEIAERLRTAIEQTKIKHQNKAKILITASFGVVTVLQTSNKIDGLLILADRALYQAKREGRNRVCRAKNEVIR